MTALRSRLEGLAVGLVEHLRAAPEPDVSPERDSPDFQVCFPYRGVFVWHVNGDDVVGDPNQVLFVSGGEAYRLSTSSATGYAELILTPAPEVLAELTRTSSRRQLARHPLFRRRNRWADLRVQRLRASFLHRAASGGLDELTADEHAMTLLRSALEAEVTGELPGSRTRRLIRRTKEFLEARATSPLRLASHSHFSAAFRRAFACTPSAFRESMRLRREPAIATSPAAPTRTDTPCSALGDPGRRSRR